MLPFLLLAVGVGALAYLVGRNGRLRRGSTRTRAAITDAKGIFTSAAFVGIDSVETRPNGMFWTLSVNSDSAAAYGELVGSLSLKYANGNQFWLHVPFSDRSLTYIVRAVDIERGVFQVVATRPGNGWIHSVMESSSSKNSLSAKDMERAGAYAFGFPCLVWMPPTP